MILSTQVWILISFLVGLGCSWAFSLLRQFFKKRKIELEKERKKRLRALIIKRYMIKRALRRKEELDASHSQIANTPGKQS